MRGGRTFLSWFLVWMVAAGVVAAGVEAIGWIEWNPEQGFYWTEQAQEHPAVRIVEDDEEELRFLLRALERLTIQEQARLMAQLQTRYTTTGPVVIEPEGLLKVLEEPDAERLREQIRTEERLHERERAGQSDDEDEDDDDDDRRSGRR